MIDLHCHSSYSDGSLEPEKLLDKALMNQIKYLALTDHDTLDGIERLKCAAKGKGIKIINGIELSIRWKKYDIHIIGLNFQPSLKLKEVIDKQKENRTIRAQQIGALLESAGISDAYNKALQIAGHTGIGRPHFAQLIMQEGKARDMQSAFKQYLLKGRVAYVPTQWISLEEAVECIVNSGGCAVIAHPLKYKLTRTKLHALIIDFKEAGGIGIEVVSGQMNGTQIQEMAGLCLRFDLLASSGSDFHGEDRSFISLGRQQALPLNCTPIWNSFIEDIE